MEGEFWIAYCPICKTLYLSEEKYDDYCCGEELKYRRCKYLEGEIEHSIL